jgi:hypothetical protein
MADPPNSCVAEAPIRAAPVRDISTAGLSTPELRYRPPVDNKVTDGILVSADASFDDNEMRALHCGAAWADLEREE